jgi:lysophospholipase L1-like esterase
MRSCLLIFCTVFLCAGVTFSDEPTAGPASPALLVDVSAPAAFTAGTLTRNGQKIPAGEVIAAPGKFGNALKFSFVENSSGGFHAARLHPTPQWDSADGFSFWVKGDGSKSFGGIEMIDRDDYSLRYGYCFPIDSTEWKKITVRWSDLTPELAGPLIGGKDGYPPSHFGSFFFGKWFYWRDYPAHSFTIDRIALEPKIPAAEIPAINPADTGLKRLRAKLAKHPPITLVTMGDSLTDQHHWSNREVVWHGLLAEAIKAKYGSQVKVINPAIGGTTLSQNMILMPRWLAEAPEPDLVTVWFGGNDWDSKVRGPRFGEYLRLCVDRIRAQTHGHADILLMTNIPSHDMWETRKELEEVTRQVAKEKQCAVADIGAAFRVNPTPDAAFAAGYWGFDKVHLGRKGHEVTRDTVMKVIEVPE